MVSCAWTDEETDLAFFKYVFDRDQYKDTMNKSIVVFDKGTSERSGGGGVGGETSVDGDGSSSSGSYWSCFCLCRSC